MRPEFQGPGSMWDLTGSPSFSLCVGTRGCLYFVSLGVSISSVGCRNRSKMTEGVSRPGTAAAGEYTVWAGWEWPRPKQGCAN